MTVMDTDYEKEVTLTRQQIIDLYEALLPITQSWPGAPPTDTDKWAASKCVGMLRKIVRHDGGFLR